MFALFQLLLSVTYTSDKVLELEHCKRCTEVCIYMPVLNSSMCCTNVSMIPKATIIWSTGIIFYDFATRGKLNTCYYVIKLYMY